MILINFIKLFLWESKIKVVGNSIFRLDFFLGILTSFIFSCGMPLFQFFIYTKTKGYPGWSFAEILLFQAVLLMNLGIMDTLFGDTRTTVERYVHLGTFDRLLLFPHRPLMIILTRGFSQSSIGTLIAGLAALIFVIVRYQINISVFNIIFFLFFLMAGILFRLSFIVLYCALTLRYIYLERAKEIIDKFLSFGNFPAEIFSGVFHFIYLTIIPIAVWIYFPVQSLLGRLNIYSVIGSIVSIFFFLVSKSFWNRQLMKYSSSGG